MPHEFLKFIEQLVLLKASVSILKSDDPIKIEILDYIDTVIAEYNVEIEEFERNMAMEMKDRSIH
jgi:hypothetical protein|tara:strand:+ start:206 stop:400 length:195 start_codon:yes stop_codon:yes gene_type:complete